MLFEIRQSLIEELLPTQRIVERRRRVELITPIPKPKKRRTEQLELVTGAGKTTVMAMLIAWQTINAVRRPGSLETRGNAPRLYRNMLVFLAADKTRLQDLDEAARRYLAWESILSEKELLNLDPQQVKQAETQKTAADTTVDARLPETFQWLLVPTQPTPQAKIEWSTHRLTGPEALAERVSKKLRSLNELVTIYAASWLCHDLDRIPLWRGDHVTIQQLIEDYGRYVDLQRLRDPKVLLGAIRNGVASLVWEKDGFALADSHDEAAGGYRGLRVAQSVTVAEGEAAGLIVKPEIARRQIETERATAEAGAGLSGAGGGSERAVVDGGAGGSASAAVTPPAPEVVARPKRFHGSVVLDSTRVGRDASRIAEEVIAHLAALVGAKVTVTLEVEAEIPDGAPEQVVRTVTENGRTLRFSSLGFEQE